MTMSSRLDSCGTCRPARMRRSLYWPGLPERGYGGEPLHAVTNSAMHPPTSRFARGRPSLPVPALGIRHAVIPLTTPNSP